MASTRPLKLGAVMRPVSIHTGAWRYPAALRDANFNFPAIKGHHLAVLNMKVGALKRSHTVTSFEPFTQLQRRALFRRDYEGATLRENLGLAPPANRFFS
jgi:hypothetical protein